MNILIVESNATQTMEFFLAPLVTFLSGRGHTIILEGTHEKGVRRLEIDGEISLIITNLGLRSFDAVDMARVLRDKSVKIPIVLLTVASIEFFRKDYPDFDQLFTLALPRGEYLKLVEGLAERGIIL